MNIEIIDSYLILSGVDKFLNLSRINLKMKKERISVCSLYSQDTIDKCLRVSENCKDIDTAVKAFILELFKN